MERRPPAPAPRRTGALCLEGGALAPLPPVTVTSCASLWGEMHCTSMAARHTHRHETERSCCRDSAQRVVGMGSRRGLRSRCGGCTCPTQCRGTEQGANDCATTRPDMPAPLLASHGCNVAGTREGQ